MKFLLQKNFKNEAFITIQRAHDYHFWKNDGKTFTLMENGLLGKSKANSDPKEWCPIGSIEFVHKYYLEHFGLELKPKNVPECLFPYAGRKINNLEVSETRILYLPRVSGLYIKSNTIEKWEGNRLYKPQEAIATLPPGSYQISEILETEAEYRCFVYEHKLLGVHFYQGDFWKYPDLDKIETMISAYKNSPSAYTLDVVIHKDSDNYVTSVLEVHDFYACALYGFQDLERLPFMYWRSHLDKINKL